MNYFTGNEVANAYSKTLSLYCKKVRLSSVVTPPNLPPKMRKTILLLTILLPLSLYSQTTELQGQILDDSTKAALPFSTVAIKGKGIGVATGMDGRFNLVIQEFSKNDSLVFRSLGYKDHSVLLSSFLNNTENEAGVEVKLAPVSFDLSEIVVFPAKEEETFGTLSNSTTGPAYSFTAGAQLAVFIPNGKGGEGIIKSVSYFFTDKKRKPTAPFRIRILEADKNGRPGKDLLLKSIVVSAPKSDEWFTVNLEEYNLPFPEHGYFAGLELIYTEKKYQFKVRPAGLVKKKKVACQGPVLGLVKTKGVSNRWMGRIGRGLGAFDYPHKGGYRYNHMIRSTIKYRE